METRRLLPILLLTALLAPWAAAAEKTAQRALELARGGDVDGAIAVLEAGEETSIAEAHLLGQLYLMAQRGADAHRVLTPLAKRADAGPALLTDAGRAALIVGQPEAAAAALERAVAATDPTAPVPDAARILGLLHLQEGNVRAAYPLLRPWATAHPDDTDARLAAAACAVELGRLPEADTLLQGLPAEMPRARLLRADVHLRRARSAEAAALLEPMAADPPPAMAAQLRRLLGRAYLGTQRPAETVALLEGHANTTVLALLLAEAHHLNGDATAAAAVLEPRTTAPDSAPEAVRDLGRYLVLAGRHADALPVLERAVAQDPEDLESWRSLSRAFFAAGRRDQATHAMERVRELQAAREKTVSREQQLYLWRLENPTEAALKDAAEARDQGDLASALDLVRQEIRLRPEDARLRFFELDTLLELGRPEEAFRAAEAGVRLAPERGDAWFHRASVLLALGRRDAAEADLRRALETTPLHPAATNTLAVHLAETGRAEEAGRLLRALLAKAPENTVARANLERLAPNGDGSP